MHAGFERFQQLVTNPVKFRLFLLQKLPSAFFAGLRMRSFDATQAAITVKHRWFTQNPFRSMYFAIQSMAAEMSTGLLGFAQVYQRQPAVSMLVTGIEGKFYKKVTGTVTFTCKDGALVTDAVNRSIATGEGIAIRCLSTGTNEEEEVVSEFWVDWSFKVKQKGAETNKTNI